MDQQKFVFITREYIPRLKNISASQKGNWGKMNAQQMVEHVADFFKVSSNKLNYPLSIPVEYLPKYKAFLLSEKEFRENTKAPDGIIPDEPSIAQYASMQESVDALKKEIGDFVQFFEQHPGAKTLHPAFGALDFEEWVLLHYKHVVHHLKQFGLQ